MRYINYMGSNASGKSTRTFHLVKYLQSQFSYEEFIHCAPYKDMYEDRNVGLLFSNGWLVLGRPTRKGDKWMGLDNAIFPAKCDRLEFFKWLVNNRPDVTTTFTEGFFNNREWEFAKYNMVGINITNFYYSFYDRVDELLARMDGRSGSLRTLEWAEGSAAWRDNKTFRNYFHKSSLDVTDNNTTERISVDAPRDFLITKFFGDNTDDHSS